MQSAAHLPPRVAALDASRPLRIAVIGVGAMGRRHARVLASRPSSFALSAVMDVSAHAAAEVAAMYGAEGSLSESDALAGADAVIVATPIRVHAETVRRALASGKHVLVEKPIAATAREAAGLVSLAESCGATRLFVGHSERFNPVVRALARLVESSSIRAIELRRVGARPSPREEGALLNLGVHDLDLAAYLTRSPLGFGHAAGELGPNGSEERAHVLSRTESGATVHVYVDQRPADSVRRRTIVLSTPTHVWHGDLLSPALVRTCRATSAREAIPLDTEEPLLAQTLAFAAAARGGLPSEIASARDGLLALRAAERAARQVRTTRPSKTCRLGRAADTRS
jgi:predicted dehydrogenase